MFVIMCVSLYGFITCNSKHACCDFIYINTNIYIIYNFLLLWLFYSAENGAVLATTAVSNHGQYKS